MNSDESTQNDGNKEHEEESEVRDLKEIKTYMEFFEKSIKELQEATKILPKVDKNGGSECPFAESLYAKKDEAEEKVIEKMKKASRYLDLLKEEIAMWRRNFTEIEIDADALNLPQAREEYNRAKKSTNIQIERNVKLQEELLDLISQAEEHIQLAQKKEWPLGKPKEGFGQTSTLGGGSDNVGPAEFKGDAPVVPVSQRPAFKTVIDDLMSLGPIGNKDS
jgi:hypothetical protein